MIRIDELVVEAPSFIGSVFKHTVRAGGKRRLIERICGKPADHARFDPPTYVRPINAEIREHFFGHAAAQPDQAQQQMRRIDVLVLQAPCLLFRES